MRKYKIAAILWQDHTHFEGTMAKNPEEILQPTLTVGIIYKETRKYYIVVSDIERYEDRDKVSYTVIFKPIINLQEYGNIELEQLRET